MPEDIVEDAVTEEPKVEPKTDGKQVKVADKKFTDSDMAALRRTLTKQHADAETAWNTDKETLQAQVDAQNTTITEMVELLKKDIELDPDIDELLSEKSPAEQLSFLLKKSAKKQDIPRTPKGSGERNNKPLFTRRTVV